jgi:hypothetical protein
MDLPDVSRSILYPMPQISPPKGNVHSEVKLLETLADLLLAETCYTFHSL